MKYFSTAVHSNRLESDFGTSPSFCLKRTQPVHVRPFFKSETVLSRVFLAKSLQDLLVLGGGTARGCPSCLWFGKLDGAIYTGWGARRSKSGSKRALRVFEKRGQEFF